MTAATAIKDSHLFSVRLEFCSVLRIAAADLAFVLYFDDQIEFGRHSWRPDVWPDIEQECHEVVALDLPSPRLAGVWRLESSRPILAGPHATKRFQDIRVRACYARKRPNIPISATIDNGHRTLALKEASHPSQVQFRPLRTRVQALLPFSLLLCTHFRSSAPNRFPVASSAMPFPGLVDVRVGFIKAVTISACDRNGFTVGHTSILSPFLTDIVLPDGRTIGQTIAPQIEAAYTTGRMPPLLAIEG